MSFTLPNGSVFAIAQSYGATSTVSAVTNATSMVATLGSGHSVIVGDYVEFTSGWGRVNNKILKATAVSTNDVTFGGIDTSSTSIYPAGAGIGSVREITNWTNIGQVMESSSQGGDQQFVDFQLLADDTMRSIPTVKNAARITLKVADDPSQAGYILALAATDDRLVRAVRATLPSGALIFYNAYISASRIPTFSVNNLMTVDITLSLVADPTRY